jgi:TetR/AcrR family transcriptional repressor of nem operon
MFKYGAIMRNKAFDENHVLTQAMHLFRHKGFGAASVKDIEQATGLKTGSIYHSYRDKDGLFRAALDHYNGKVVAGRIERFLPQRGGIAGLRALFQSLLHEPGGAADGCLLTNSAIEFGAAEASSRDAVHQGFDLLRDAFERVLAESGTAKPQAVALRLLVLYQGLLVLVRGGYARGHLAQLIDLEFSNMEQTHDER